MPIYLVFDNQVVAMAIKNMNMSTKLAFSKNAMDIKCVLLPIKGKVLLLKNLVTLYKLRGLSNMKESTCLEVSLEFIQNVAEKLMENYTFYLLGKIHHLNGKNSKLKARLRRLGITMRCIFHGKETTWWYLEEEDLQILHQKYYMTQNLSIRFVF